MTSGIFNLITQVFDAWFGYQEKYSNLPGFQVCVRKNNQLLYNKSYGYKNLCTNEKLTNEDLFRIASHSKTFTACAILKLKEQGLLRLDDLLVHYVPEIKNHKDKRFQEITLRDLVSNRSGLFRDGLDSGIWDLFYPFPSKDELIKEVLSSDLIFSSNTETKYSNIGFSLLGCVIETILGTPYGDAIHSLILKDIKGDFFPDYSRELSSRMVQGYSRVFDHKRHPLKQASANALGPAAGFCASAADTNLFFDKLLSEEGGILQKETHRELLSLKWGAKNAPLDDYGLGLLFTTFSDGQLIGHRGGYPGFSTYTAHWLDEGYTFSFFLNTNDTVPILAVRSMAQLIFKIHSMFTEEEAHHTQVSPLLMGGLVAGTGSVFVLGKKKALFLPLESWTPAEQALALTSKDGEAFLCEGQSGYSYLGEKIIFEKNNKDRVVAVKWGGSFLVEENIFLEKIRETFV